MSNSTKGLSYFMREQKDEIVHYPAPPSFPEGTPDLQFRILSQKEMNELRKHWVTKTIVKDNKAPVIYNGKVVYDEEFDNEGYSQELIAESLVYPDLGDKELRDFYNCIDKNKMPMLVFSSPEDWAYVIKAFDEIHGFRKKPDIDNEVNDAKK